METLFTANQTLSLYLLNEKHLFDNTTEKEFRQGNRNYWIPISSSKILFESGKIILKTSNKILFSDYEISKNRIDEFISENIKPLDLEYYFKNNK